MPTTVPDVSVAAPNQVGFAVRYIDHTGDKRSVYVSGLDVSGYTLAEIESFKVELAAKTDAEIYEIVLQQTWGTVPNAGNASAGNFAEVNNHVKLLAKNAAGDALDLWIPAPDEALFIGNDVVDTTTLSSLIALWLAMVPAGYTATQLRYHSGHQVNPAQALST